MLQGTLRGLRHATRLEDLSVESLDYLRSLPTTLRISGGRPGWLLCHGLGPHDMASVRSDDFGYALEMNFELHDLIADPGVEGVFNGHTHRRMVRHFDGLTIVNAGSLVSNQEPGILLVDPESGDVSWLSLEAPRRHAVSALGSIRPTSAEAMNVSV
jgi:predicted phosphodiesterase